MARPIWTGVLTFGRVALQSEQIAPGRSKTIEISGFVDLAEVGPIQRQDLTKPPRALPACGRPGRAGKSSMSRDELLRAIEDARAA